MNQEQGAKELVDRARCGDQNAVAMIAMIRKNADQGNGKAKTALGYILDYLQENPSIGCFGAEQQGVLGVVKAADQNDPKVVLQALAELLPFGAMALGTAIAMMSFNKPITKQKVSQYASVHGDDQSRNLFLFGVAEDERKIRPVANRLDPRALGVVCAGHCVGSARRIQLARLKKVPISVLGYDIGWEFGR